MRPEGVVALVCLIGGVLLGYMLARSFARCYRCTDAHDGVEQCKGRPDGWPHA